MSISRQGRAPGRRERRPHRLIRCWCARPCGTSSSSTRSTFVVFTFCSALVGFDMLVHPVFLPIQLPVLGFGEVPVILRQVVGFLLFDAIFRSLQMGGLLRSETSIVHPLGDLLLLVLFPLVHFVYPRMSRVVNPRARFRAIRHLLGEIRMVLNEFLKPRMGL